MRFIPIIVLILVSASFSDTATQTDWDNIHDLATQIVDAGDFRATERIVVLK